MSVPNAKLWVGLVCLGAVACGARSNVYCSLGECTSTDEGMGGSQGQFGGVGGNVSPDPPDLDPPIEIPPPSMERPPDDLPVSGASDFCRDRIRAEGNIVINRRRELERLRGCQEVGGDLTLIGFTADDLEPLNELERVLGNLHLEISARLDGLESLRQVWGLSLEGLNTPTLAPLSNLTRIGIVDGDPDAALRIVSTEGFRDLEGLSRATMRGHVTIESNPRLESLRGLSLASSLEELSVRANNSLVDLGPATMLTRAGTVVLDGNQFLVDLGALSQLETVEKVLEFEGLAIESLDMLQALERATDVSIRQNGTLTSVDRLASVEFSSLRVTRNPSLASLPEFPGVFQLQQLQVRDNDALTRGPRFPALTQANRILISGNPGLARIDGFPLLQTIDTLEVRDNSSLIELGLGAVTQYELARIICNPALTEQTIAQRLGSIGGQLELRGNLDSILPCG
jgi:hypothetical protein